MATRKQYISFTGTDFASFRRTCILLFFADVHPFHAKGNRPVFVWDKFTHEDIPSSHENVGASSHEDNLLSPVAGLNSRMFFFHF
jgi:hypothetical protein